jgi:hypothetical protein
MNYRKRGPCVAPFTELLLERDSAIDASRSLVVTPRLALLEILPRLLDEVHIAERGRDIGLHHPADAAAARVEQLGNTLLQAPAGEQRADRQLVPVGDRGKGRRGGALGGLWFFVHHHSLGCERRAQIVRPMERPHDLEI